MLDMAKTPKDQDEYSDEETTQRRDAVLKRMLNTPPKPRPKRERTTNKRKPQQAGDKK